ncbi:histidine kinase [Halomonas sp. PR-M31]|uniref:histidine kinase n=1 Tax=Halomonas sp. PR-M31 TaxID=1471202 RepID=UPI00065130FD|nr:histidine kinase [Halomonas sp. PR-M31]
MSYTYSQSLFFRTGLTMAGIVILALTSMLSSIVIAETAGGDAAAINQAGSIRMQAYRLYSTLGQTPAANDLIERRIARLDQDLREDSIVSLVPGGSRHPLTMRYEEVLRQWEETLRPALLKPDSAERQALSEQVARFVAEMNAFVSQLQKRAESRIEILRLVQGVALFLTLVLAFFAMYQLASITPPLRELFTVVNQARLGNFDQRTHYQNDNELGLISRTINQMNESLSQMYAQLEQRVALKTLELQRSNDALSLLYQTARQLGGFSPGNERYREILDRLERITEAHAITLHLDGDVMPAGTQIVPIRKSGQDYGQLLLRYPQGKRPQRWQQELIETVADLIAAAQSLAKKSDQQRRLALMDERSVIARELHDSLAQSLSYLKIQVARLQMQIRQQKPQAEQQVVIDELREGLNAAYRQLRELLSTFRLQMNVAGLEAALRETAREFSQRGELEIQLDYAIGQCPLTPNEEVHVLHLVREALANVIHHAKARRCSIRLFTDAKEEIVLNLRDDGIGLPDRWERLNHYGTIIMGERAAALGGHLALQRHPEGGTLVALRFMPRLIKDTSDVEKSAANPLSGDER